jgi:hypothetical protein
VEEEAHEHVTFSWEPPLPLPFKHPPKLFNLVPYMLRKYDWLSNSINDFKKQLAIYIRLSPKEVGKNGLITSSSC